MSDKMSEESIQISEEDHFIGQLPEITVHTFSNSNYWTLILTFTAKTQSLFKNANDGNIPNVNRHGGTKSVEPRG